MKTEWDYTNLVNAYLKRPDYAQGAIDRMLSAAGIHEGDAVCDVGAGTGNLTRMLAAKKLEVTAIEPNEAMRVAGIEKSRGFPGIRWVEGVGEQTGQAEESFRLVSFGSSFNVTERQQTLRETHRILARGGWFACMWNHRNLEDPVQSGIEKIIRTHLPDYTYGTRREDQTEIISNSGLFTEIQCFSSEVNHTLKTGDIIEAWSSHATLKRQAKDQFDRILGEIEDYLRSFHSDRLTVPYTTRVWMARALK